MICPHCSNSVRDDAVFCPVCGARLTPSAPQSPVPQPSVPTYPQSVYGGSPQDAQPVYQSAYPASQPPPLVRDPLRISKGGMIAVVILSAALLLISAVNYAFYDISTFDGGEWSLRFIVVDCCELLLGFLPLPVLSLMLKKLPPFVMAIPLFLFSAVRILNVIVGVAVFQSEYDAGWYAYLFYMLAVSVCLFFALSVRGKAGFVLRIVTSVLAAVGLVFYIVVQHPFSMIVEEIRYIGEYVGLLDMVEELAYLTDMVMYLAALALIAAIEIVLCLTVKERKKELS